MPQKTSPAKISKKRFWQGGFTLIEIMIVITIIAAVMAIGAPLLVNKKSKMKSTIQKIAVMAREVHSLAKLENRTYRIVLSMNQDKGHSYWVESANGQVGLLSEEKEKELSFLTKIDRDEKVGESPFKIDTHVTKEPIKFPKDLYVLSVEYGSRSAVIDSGVAYIHFLPQGLTEEAVIHLGDRKTLNWTIAIHPLTGRATIFEKYVSLKELQNR